MRFDRILAALNTDGDTVISAAELDNVVAALKKLDKNGDGKLTEDELRPNFEGGRGPGGPGGGPANNLSDETIKTLMEFDRNGDGKLSKEELPERMQGLLARGDADKDGFLTKEELKKMAEAQSSAGSGRPGEGRMGERGGRPEGPGGREGGGRMVTPAMAALDANGDGTISADEISNAPAALKKLDKNGDGKLTEDEVRPNFGGGRGPGGRGPGGPGGRNSEEMINHLFEENDKNGDGKLSKDEVPERMQAMFERGDTNKDGFLSKEELKALFESQGRPGQGRPGGRDGEERPQRQRP